MPRIVEDKLTFDFPDKWQAEKFDGWSFYRNQYQRIAGARMPCTERNCPGELVCSKCGKKRIAANRGIDILAIAPGTCCWNIEVKDYREHRRTKTIDLADEVALKVRDTLAALVAAQANANDEKEKAAAEAALKCPAIRVVLHLEQPVKHSKLFPRVIDPAKIMQRLKQLIKAIDPHPLVVAKDQMLNLEWTVN